MVPVSLSINISSSADWKYLWNYLHISNELYFIHQDVYVLDSFYQKENIWKMCTILWTLFVPMTLSCLKEHSPFMIFVQVFPACGCFDMKGKDIITVIFTIKRHFWILGILYIYKYISYNIIIRFIIYVVRNHYRELSLFWFIVFLVFIYSLEEVVKSAENF